MENISYDWVWVIATASMVFLMQAGFTVLESGMVRAKNSINVAIKNVIDFSISIVVFTFFGFAFMFGESVNGFVGVSHFLLDGYTLDAKHLSFFFFFAMFCGTTSTIVSGAVAERMKFSSYIITTVILAGFIYPVVGHWVWNGINSGQNLGWLAQIGFIDLAGSTVVHSVAGWMAFAAILIIGPRIGRFGKDAIPIEGYSLPIAVLGLFLLWFGWFGFNAGSTLSLNDEVPIILVNTLLAGSSGGIVSLVISWKLYKKPKVTHVINGTLAGLVAITASANIMTPMSAMIIGAGGGIALSIGLVVLEYFEIDDAIGAVPTHLFPGIWGTLAVSFFAPLSVFKEGFTRFDQFLVQLGGVLVVGVFVFGFAYILLKIINRYMPLRVSAKDEEIGLNISEHGAGTDFLDLLSQMNRQAQEKDFYEHINIHKNAESASIANFYNGVLDGFNEENTRRDTAIAKLTQLANYDPLTGLVNRRYFYETGEQSLFRHKRHDTKCALLYIDLDGFKAVNDSFGHESGDKVLIKISNRMTGVLRQTDLLGRLGGDEFAILLENIKNEDEAKEVANKIIEAVSRGIELKDEKIFIGASIGIKFIYKDETLEEVISEADKAMYGAKIDGRGRFHIAK